MSFSRYRGPFYLLTVCLSVYILLSTSTERLPKEWLLYQNLTSQQRPSICNLKPLDPFDSSIQKYIAPSANKLNCKPIQDKYAKLTNRRIEVLKLDAQCRYRSVEHNSGVDDFEPKYGEWKDINGSRSDLISTDFVQMECTKQSLGISQTVYRNTFFQIVARNVSGENNKPFSKLSKDKVNVLMLGIDGVSRSNFMRQMPKTVTTMSQMGFVTMDSHSKLGDNTFPNLCTILLGKRGYLSEKFPNEVDDGWGLNYDNWTELMWRRFSREGYATLYTEDKPEWFTFAYKKKSFGFVQRPPTDHYQRPHFLSIYDGLDMMRSSSMCFDDTPLHMLQLKYIEEFLHTYRNLSIPTFTFSWNVELAHEYLNTLGVADEDFSQFLTKNEELWKDTVVMILSDHGNRYDAIRETIVGRMESRLPVLSIRLPEVLTTKYPGIAVNLKKNSKKFTTHFDIHETLNDILKMSYTSPSFTERGHSLLGIVPSNRTCPQLNIPDSYCPCYDEIVLSPDKGESAAQFLTSEVNRLIDTSTSTNLCIPLTLSEILSVSIRLPPKGIINDRSIDGVPTGAVTVIYRISIRMASPSDAVFEAVLFRDVKSDSWKLDGDIERNNKYGSTSWCVKDRILQKYCYCKEQKT